MPLRKIVLLFLVFSIAYSYQYNDYIWESYYKSPAVVEDNLILNCLNLVDESICDSINNHSLSVNEKKQLILDGLNPNAFYPNYGFIETYNSNIGITKYAPESAQVYNSGSIKDAWVKILYLNPSVELENKTLLDQSGKIYSGYSFNFVVPDKKALGDCKTLYVPKGYDYSLDIYLNGNKINDKNTKDAEYSLNLGNNTFQAKLSIQSEYDIDHYHLVTYCSKYGCVTVCTFYKTEKVIDTMTINDYKTAYLYNFTHETESIVDKNYSNLIDFWFSFNVSDDYSNIKFESSNATIFKKGVDYKLKYEHEPYNIITYEAIKKEDKTQSYAVSLLSENTTKNNSTIYSKIHVLAPYSGKCSLEIVSHFEKYIYDDFCTITNEEPKINITLLDKTADKITLEILFYESTTGEPLIGKEMILFYGGIEKKVKTDDEGKAVVEFDFSNHNSIVKAVFITDLETKSTQKIYVIPNEELDLLEWIVYSIALLFSLSILYNFSRRLV